MPKADLPNTLHKKHVDTEEGLHSLDWITTPKIATGVAEAMCFLHDECSPPFVHSRLMVGPSSKAIVIPATGGCLGVALRNGDMSWKDFLSRSAGRSSIYSPVIQSADTLINILFSSGTTGEPKAIPWTQLCPIRCGADTWAHLDVRPKDIGMSTNLGWVMGLIELFSCFLNGATLTLYHGYYTNI